MFDLTTIQCINDDAVTLHLFDEMPEENMPKPHKAIYFENWKCAAACHQMQMRQDKTSFTEEMDSRLAKPFTHGEWESRQKDKSCQTS